VDEDVATGVEAAIFGPISRSEIDSWLAQALAQSGAGRLAEALFHAGRIDAVYGVVTDDGHQLVIRRTAQPTLVTARELFPAALTCSFAQGARRGASKGAGQRPIDVSAGDLRTDHTVGARRGGLDPSFRTAHMA
jgi:hypothetical protein